jgi:hypothetical protein
VRQLGDLDAPEQPERRQPTPALDQVRQAERLPRPEEQLAPDDRRVGARVPDDEDVVDDRLRTFGDPVDDAALVPSSESTGATWTSAEAYPSLRYSSKTSSRSSAIRGTK